MKVEHVAPDDLNPAGYNPRTMSDEARARLCSGIEHFGLVDPIIARREDRLVIGGHQRLTVAKELGLEAVPVVFLDGLSDDDAKALNIALNNAKAQGEFDTEMLNELLTELRDSDLDAALTAFSLDEIDELLETPSVPGDDTGDPPDGADVEFTVKVTLESAYKRDELLKRLRAEGYQASAS